jgi:hypothetical protein
MYAFTNSGLFNAGLPYEFPYLTLGLFILLFVIVIVIEGIVLRKQFNEFSMMRGMLFSALMNFISALFGIPLLFISKYFFSDSSSFSFNFIRWMLVAYVITVIVELLILILLHKPRPPLKKALAYSLNANSISYLVITLGPLSIGFFILLARAFLSGG